MNSADKSPQLVFMFKPPVSYGIGMSIFWDFCHPLIKNHLSTDFFDPDRQYSADTVFYYDGWNDCYGVEQLARHLEQGYRVVFDNKNERDKNIHLFPDVYDLCNQYVDQCFWLVSGSQLAGSKLKHSVIPLWFWSFDYLNFKRYQNYQPNPTHEYKFLMLMRRKNSPRDCIYNELTDILPTALYSYRHRGITVAGDLSEDTGEAQRMVDPTWYDRTSLSLVVETDVDPEENIFITEKTFKPIIMLHPWIVYGQPGSLAFMQQHGFETFPELWDESYDSIVDFRSKAQTIHSILKEFDHTSINQPRVQEKLQHNRNKFFDRTQAEAMYTEHLVKPLYNFVNE